MTKKISNKITKSVVDRAVYSGDGKSRCFIWDSEVTGFGLRVYPSGKKSFCLSYYAGARKRLLTIGMFGHLTTDQAKNMAREYCLSIKLGKDPLDVRNAERAADTVEEFCETYIREYAMLKKKTWKKDQSRIQRYILPVWGKRKIKSITAHEVEQFHSKIGERAPTEANRVLQQLSKMFNLARRWKVWDQSALNPASGITKFKENKRDIFLKPEDLPKLIESIDKEESPYVRAAFRLYILTGVRKSELLNAKWEDVDFVQRELRLGMTKSGKAHTVPLSSSVIDILHALPKHLNNPFILPGLKPSAPIVNLDKAWFRSRKRAGLQNLRLHDLRRTFASWMVRRGVSIPVIGKILNHQHSSTTDIYARPSTDLTRTAMEIHGKEFENQIRKLESTSEKEQSHGTPH